MVLARVAKGCKNKPKTYNKTQYFIEFHVMWKKEDSSFLPWEFFQQHPQRKLNHIWFARTNSHKRTANIYDNNKKNAIFYQKDGE